MLVRPHFQGVELEVYIDGCLGYSDIVTVSKAAKLSVLDFLQQVWDSKY